MSRSSSGSEPAERGAPAGDLYVFLPEGGEPVTVGRVDPPGEVPVVRVHLTRDRSAAEVWREELAAGRAPG